MGLVMPETVLVTVDGRERGARSAKLCRDPRPWPVLRTRAFRKIGKSYRSSPSMTTPCTCARTHHIKRIPLILHRGHQSNPRGSRWYQVLEDGVDVLQRIARTWPLRATWEATHC
mmetsp:Transcript_1237/g.2045  ORF Transcript_1237/g.2045 Transcript_1237/m.2045 type:complete len:115 (+) Transcript_1237:1525-1869(+)